MYEASRLTLSHLHPIVLLATDIRRALMRIESTVSIFTAAIATLTYRLQFNSSRNSICHVLTKETARQVHFHRLSDIPDLLKVDPSKVPCLANWKRDFNMETILIELRRYMSYSLTSRAFTDILLDTWLCRNTRSFHSLRKGRHSSSATSLWTVLSAFTLVLFSQWSSSKRFLELSTSFTT